MKIIFSLILFPLVIFSQERFSVNGIVISGEDQSAIVGASIIISNTTIGTSTDTEGNFLLKRIPSDKKELNVFAVGYKTQNVILSGSNEEELTIILTPSLIQTQTVVVTANKRPQSLEEIPVSMSIIDAKMFEEKNIVSVDDALRYVPGVNFQQSQINIRASSGYSRGVGSRIMLLVDGMPLLTGDTGEIIFESIPVFQIERVEVVKGAGSTLYGSGALNGVINVLTKDAKEQPTMFWKLYSGVYSHPQYDEWKWSDKERFMNGQLFGFSSKYDNLGVTFSMSRHSDDGYRESDWIRKYNGYVKLKYDFSPYQSMTYSSNFYYHHRADFIWWKDFHNALRPADTQRDITVNSLRFNNALSYKHFVSDNFFFEVKAVHFRGNWYRDSIANHRLDHSISDAFVTDVQGNLTVNEDHILTFGMEGNYERVRADIFGSHEGNGGAFYLQDEFHIAHDLSGVIGVRHDFEKTIGTSSEQQTNPKFGMRYQISEGHTIRLSVGRGFRSPSIGEFFTSTSNTGSSVIVVPSINLKPEHSWTFEISGTSAITEHLQFDAAIFHSDYSNLIEPNVFLDTIAKVNFKNITEARIQGFEVSILSALWEHSLTVNIHYNYNWAIDRNTKSFLRFRPRHIAGANVSFQYDAFNFGLDYRYVSRIEQIDEALVDLAPIKNGRTRVSVSVLDLRCIANLNDIGLPFRASLNVNNATGYNYNELIGNISPPRHFVLSIEGVIQ